MTWTEEQRSAGESPASRVVVLAGPGTGKTQTLIGRLAHQIRAGAEPRKVLLLTFTRKAAANMVARASRLVPDASEVWAGTFHSVACRFLRRLPGSIGMSPSATILDEDDQTRLLEVCARRRGWEKDLPNIRDIQAAASLARNCCRDVALEFEAIFGPEAPRVATVWRDYEAWKRDATQVDFDGLLEKWAEALADPMGADALSRAVTHVLVDEGQDVNVLQSLILRRMAASHLTVVGDLCQAIYKFRGAEPDILRRIVESRRYEVHRLTRNFRSGQSILDAANTVVEGVPHALRLAAARPLEAQFHLLRFHNPYAEGWAAARWIVERQKRAPDETIAILGRTAWLLQQVELALSRSEVRYTKFIGTRFCDRLEIRDLAALVRLAVNRRDYPAWRRALLLYPGVGQKRAGKLAEELCDPHDADLLGGTPADRLLPQHGASALGALAGSASAGASAAPVLAEVGAILAPLLQTAYGEDAPSRKRNVSMAIGSCKPGETVQEWLDSMATAEDEDDGPGAASRPRVVVSTIHSAKGLEWDAVWIVGAGDRQIPGKQPPENLDEEHRLLYVGMTRARSELIVSWPWQVSQSATQPASRFLGGLRAEEWNRQAA